MASALQAETGRLLRKTWPKQARERVAELVNDALVEAGVERRVDPRTYRDMGIDREPEPRATAAAYSRKSGLERRRPGPP